MNDRTVYGIVAGACAIVVACILIFVIMGCATTQPPAPPVVASAPALPPIRIPVIVPCLTAEQIPPPPPSMMQAGRSGWHNELSAAIDLKQLDEYMVKSQSLLWGCVKSFEPEVKKP